MTKSSTPTETLSKDYAATAENLSAILKKELTYYSCKGYLNSSDPTMITAADRMKVVDWCYGVVDHYHLSRETVANAMEMVDRFLSVSAGPSALWDINSDVAKAGGNALHSQSTFQLLTVAALYSCLKAKDDMFPINQFAESYCKVYTKEEIDAMKHILLRGLSWRTNTPTAHQVGHATLSLLVPHVNLPESTWGFLLDEMKYQTEIAVRDYYFSTQRPSTIALASIYNAIEKVSSKPDKEMLSTFLLRTVGCYEYGESMHINAARRRLQQLLQGDNVFEETDINTFSQVISQDPVKTLELDFEVKSTDSKSVPTPHEPQRSPFCSDFLDSVTLQAVDNFMATFPIDYKDEKMPSLSASELTTLLDKMPEEPSHPFNTSPSLPTFTVATLSSGMAPKKPENSATASAQVTPVKAPKKPVRPLTAYHMFLQIEKEFIIQTMAGEDADETIHDDKVYLDYVPERYRKIKLSPDWYHKAVKRKRRKHRKQHGKIGFKELTCMIATRWADLEKTNPEVKKFVRTLAEQELSQYRREMEEYYTASIAHNKNSSIVSKSKPPPKRAHSDVEYASIAPIKPHKQPRRMSSMTGLASVGEVAHSGHRTVFSSNLNSFHYHPATKHRENSHADGTNEEDQPLSRMVSREGKDLFESE
jgi:hypothetical protein